MLKSGNIKKKDCKLLHDSASDEQQDSPIHSSTQAKACLCPKRSTSRITWKSSRRRRCESEGITVLWRLFRLSNYFMSPVKNNVCVCVCVRRQERLTNRCWRDEFIQIKRYQVHSVQEGDALWEVSCWWMGLVRLSGWQRHQFLWVKIFDPERKISLSPPHTIIITHSASPPCAQTAPRVTAGPRPQTWLWPVCRNTWWGPGCWSILPAGGLDPSSLTWRNAGPAVVVWEENMPNNNSSSVPEIYVWHCWKGWSQLFCVTHTHTPA